MVIFNSYVKLPEGNIHIIVELLRMLWVNCHPSLGINSSEAAGAEGPWPGNFHSFRQGEGIMCLFLLFK